MPTVQEIQRAPEGDEPLTMLTAYDAPTAAIVDEAGIDLILVGDSMGNAVLGYESTLPVTMEEVASHTGAVARAVDDALVVADMPFLSYGTTKGVGIENAGRLIKEAGANAVKIESGPHTVDLTERLVDLGIPVMAHLGLTPQRRNQIGGYARQGTTEEAAAEIRDLAAKHESAGAFSLVLEHVPDELAAEVTAALDIPVIGIGAGPETDGQVLVLTDVIGLSESVPPFAEQFGDVRREIEDAVAAYRDAVEDGSFP
ncbi:3-methyl-2-oxobutanoate hydroxymethyltransferase [Haloplanus aerogenes]|uniref:3-methyl-2-oxobutanoate hydroxymethyltransferase n=1 Tax=Haloplanus aerogenes TaxID=660522 RepID=A0A3G8QWS1_9EURY|nr:3-methyl-2-oxobutanoate hydroxymethyltransferase [Haloplanus aerogenes]AZH25294.1 3-methyl-2-oxobutanoate hydroxymethyltransferase [Haloplanus aerogenes]RMB24989.1 3-methyl-2-oxobutanoate hydroxymethyltransferase [Haloplanus aerogenes]